MDRNPYSAPESKVEDVRETAAVDERIGIGRSRTFTAIIVSALVPALGLFGFGFVNTRRWPGDSTMSFLAIVVFYGMAAMLTALVGLPYRFFARRWDFARAWVSAGIGITVGMLCAYAMDYGFAHAPEGVRARVPFFIYPEFAAIGAATGFVFWSLAKAELRGRPRR